VERDAFGEPLLAELERTLAGHPHRRRGGLDRRRAAGVREPARLAHERVAPAERGGVDQLHE
jgi:hypothetical protein